MPTLAEDLATIAMLTPVVRMGIKSQYENNRRLEFDVVAAASQLSAAEARVAAAQGCRPQVRRLLSIQHGKGL